MAQDTAVLTYDAVGNLEDLSDVITNISPLETPMFSNFGRSSASAKLHEWLTDSLATATSNAKIEGAAYTFAKAAARTRLTNDVQTLETSVEVSDLQRKVATAGLDDEFAYQMAKKMKEHARDIEYAIVNGTGNSGASGTARELKGVIAWISTNNTTGTGTGNEALTEDMFNDTLENIWNQGGKPDTCYANGGQKRAISAFTAGATKFVQASGNELNAAYDIYESDFGRIKIVADRFMPSTTIAMLQSDLWKVAVLDATHKVDVAKVGSSTKAVITTSLTIEALNEAGSGKVTQLS